MKKNFKDFGAKFKLLNSLFSNSNLRREIQAMVSEIVFDRNNYSCPHSVKESLIFIINVVPLSKLVKGVR